MAIGIERETPMTHYIESNSSNKTNVTFSGKVKDGCIANLSLLVRLYYIRLYLWDYIT